MLAPARSTWRFLTQLGADRGGFFSFAFIEKAMGYHYRHADRVTATNTEMPVGRVVPASLDDARSIIKYAFRVLEVVPGESFVLENWGAFMVRSLDAERCRLIVRTHGRGASLAARGAQFVTAPFHYLMERRMLTGLKTRTEAGDGPPPSNVADNLWLLGHALTVPALVALALVASSWVAVAIATLLAASWLLPLLVLEPRPVWSLTWSAAALATVGFVGFT